MNIKSITSVKMQPKRVQKQVTNPITENVSSNCKSTLENSSVSNAFRSYALGGINFTGHSCPTSEFKVKKLEEIPCACCGKPMLTTKSLGEFTEQATQVCGEQLAELLTENLQVFRPKEKAVVNYIIKKANEDKDSDIDSVFTRYNPSAEEIYKLGQNSVLNEVQAKAKEILGEDNIITPLIEQSRAKVEEKTLDRKQFLKDLKNTSKQINDEEKAGQLMDTAISMPFDEEGIQEFLDKYSNAGSNKLAKRLAQRAEMTAEHIHPHSKGGRNHTSNYMGECAECNNNRGTIPLDRWMEEYPNMPRSSQRYIDEVTERIVVGEVGERYDDYPVDLEKTLKRETEGVIRLKVKTPEEIDKIREEKGYKKAETSDNNNNNKIEHTKKPKKSKSK